MNRETLYKIATNHPDHSNILKEMLNGKVLRSIMEKRNDISLQDHKEWFIVERILPTFTGRTLSLQNAYFVNVNTGEIVKLKPKMSHSRAIALDSTRKGETFGITREELIPIIKKLGFTSLLDYAHLDKYHYSPEILSLAAKNGWVRVNATHRDHHFEFQGNTFKQIAKAMSIVREANYIDNALVETYRNNSKTLHNKREVNYFIAHDGKYRRIAIADFR